LLLLKPLRATDFPLPVKDILIGVSRLARIFPFILGPLLLSIPLERESLQVFITIYLLFVLVFGFWFLLKEGLLNYLNKKDSTRLHSIIRVTLLALLAVMFLGSLELLRIRISDSAFYLVLFLMAPLGLTRLFRERKQYSYYILCLLVFYTGISYLSLNLSINAWQFQPIILSMSLACAIVAIDMADILRELQTPLPAKRAPGKGKNKKLLSPSTTQEFSVDIKTRKSYTRTYALLLFSAPALISLLYALGIFPPLLLLTLITVPFALELTTQVDKAVKDAQECPPMLTYATRVYLFSYLFTLVLASLL